MMLLVAKLMSFCYGATLIQQLGSKYCSQSEVFPTYFYDYFDGNFLNFTLKSENETQKVINLVNLTFFKNLKYESNEGQAKFLIFKHNTVFIAKGLDLLMFGDFEFDETSKKIIRIKSNLKEARIVDADVDSFNTGILIVTGIDTIIKHTSSGPKRFEFEVNEIYRFEYSSYLKLFKYTRIYNWDLRNVQNLRVLVQFTMFPIFWGKIGKKSFIFASFLELDTLIILNQVSDYYTLNSTELSPLDIIDMALLDLSIFVLDSSQYLISFLHYEGIVWQISTTYLEDVGKPLKINPNLNQKLIFDTTNQTEYFSYHYGVLSTEGLSIIEYTHDYQMLIKHFYKADIPYDAFVTIDLPDILIYSSSWKFMEILNFDFTRFYTIAKIPFQNYNKPIFTYTSSYQHHLIRSNDSYLEIFKFSDAEMVFIERGENKTVTIIAADHFSSVNSTMTISVIKDNYEPHLINNYLETSGIIEQNVFINSKQLETYVNLFDVVSGWNLSIKFEQIEQKGLKYEITRLLVYENNTFSRELNGIYKDGYSDNNNLYTISSKGVFLNEELIIDIPNPLKIAAGSTLNILYENFILFYNFDNKNYRKKEVSYNCSKLFKSKNQFTFCADDQYVYVFKDSDTISDKNKIKKIIKRPVIDADVWMSPDDSCLFYLLTDQDIFVFEDFFQAPFLRAVNPTSSNFVVFQNTSYIFLIGENIQTYDCLLSELKGFLKLPGIPTSVSNINSTLYLEINNNLYIFTPNAPVLQSLIALLPIDNCKLCKYSKSPMILCEKKATIFTFECPYICSDLFKITFSFNYTYLSYQGVLPMKLDWQVHGKNTNITITSKLNVILYAVQISMNDQSLSENGLIANFKEANFYPLQQLLTGYNLSFVLYVNDSIPHKSFPVYINNIISNQTYKNSSLTFVDHDVIKDKALVIILCSDSIITLNINSKNSGEMISNFEFNSTINGSIFMKGLFPFCSYLNYVSEIDKNILMLVVCQEYLIFTPYFKERYKITTTVQICLVFIQYDLHSDIVSQVNDFYVNHYISYIGTIPSSSSCFIVICIDSILSDIDDLNINNNLYIYSANLVNGFEIKLIATINLITLKLNKLFISSADGVYISSPRCSGNSTLYLYISDLYYGIRVVSIKDGNIKLIKSVKKDDKFLSLVVCGSAILAVSEDSYIYEYFYDKNYELNFHLRFEPFKNNDLEYSNSIISYSDFYRPRYLSLYYKSTIENKIQLRILDMYALANSTQIATIDFPYNWSNYIPKSKFIDSSSFTVLDPNLGILYLFKISEPGINIESIDEKKYDELVKTYGSGNLSLKIGYYNSENSKNSSSFSFKIIKNIADDDSDDNSNDLKIFWIVIAGLSIAAIIITVIVFRKLMKKKKQQIEIKQRNLLGTIQMTQCGRLGLLINIEDSNVSFR